MLVRLGKFKHSVLNPLLQAVLKSLKSITRSSDTLRSFEMIFSRKLVIFVTHEISISFVKFAELAWVCLHLDVLQ